MKASSDPKGKRGIMKKRKTFDIFMLTHDHDPFDMLNIILITFKLYMS